MGIFKTYFDSEDKKQLEFYKQQLLIHTTAIEGIKLLADRFFTSKLAKYKLDPSKEWTIDMETAQIREINQESKP